MEKPLVAIIGRPNVGKSTLFNKLCGKRISIVKNTPGVTRDRIYGDSDWCGYAFSVVDTGGIDFKETSELQQNITKQAELAVDLADVVVFVVDGKYGLNPSDFDAVNFLRKFNVPVVLAVNKIDSGNTEHVYDFYKLGLGEPIAISAEQSKGLGDLLDAIVSKFKVKVSPDENKEKIKIAIVGKPNAGKSSILNKLVGEERAMVSAIAGTTRDVVNTPFSHNNRDYLLIDTAGIRRKRSIQKESVELYSVIRAFEAIRNSDVALLVIDANEGISEQDVRLAGFIHEEGKPSVIIMNKWDLIEKDEKTMNRFNENLAGELKFMSYFVSLYTSAQTNQRLNKIIEQVDKVYANTYNRISTSNINEILQNAVLVNEPPTKKGRACKIYYITQVSVAPPTFVLFVNDKKLLHFSYLRYLENCIRNAYDFSGTPIRLIVRNKGEK